MSKLTTHVLDTAKGCPGQGIKIVLYNKDITDKRNVVAETVTNADGRTDKPLLEDDKYLSGFYELDFHVGEYFQDLESIFLDVVTVRFRINQDESYHVPLLVSPYGYTTYRGS